MQIHELTQQQLDEGFMDAVNDFKKAFKTPGAMTNTAKFNQIKQQSQSQQQTSNYVKKLAAEWLQVAKTIPPTEPAPAKKPATKKAAPGQMPAGVAASKTGQQMQQMYGQPSKGIQGMDSDLEEASLPDAIKGNIQQWKDTFKGSKPAPNPTSTATPTPTATPTATPTPTPTATPAAKPAFNKTAFQKWVDGKMSATIPGTTTELNMDLVRKEFPDVKQQLSSAMARVEQAPTDSAAIEAYIAIAVQGIQKLSQQLKQQDPSLAKKSMSYELGPAQRNNNYVKTTNNPEADAVLKAQGFIVQ